MNNVTALTTPSQIDAFRLSVVIRAIETHIRTNGQMMLTRMATPSNLRTIASEYTGKSYARSRKGLELALADLQAIKESLVA